jgi:nucleoside-diphosphate-sugar epimerase
MRILVCGADGYIGYALATHLLKMDHEVYGLDCFHRRKMVREMGLESIIPIASQDLREKELKGLGDFQFECIDIAEEYVKLSQIFKKFKPEGIVNLAQQPSAAYSMIDPEHGNFTMRNNVQGLLNIYWAMRDYVPESHVVTLGTMGEYGFPNVPIPEGFFEIEFEGMKDIMPFPRQTNSVYHTSKVQATDLSWMACRVWELRATDIHQGVVYGTRTEDMDNARLRTRFDVGECFGTMINRAVACAVMGHPIIPYGSGMQKRGYIALRDSIKCLTLAVENHPTDDDSIHGYRVINQFDECYTCNELGEAVKEVANEKFGLDTTIKHIENPRVEAEVHFYKPHHKKLYTMGWQPTRTLKEELATMIEDLLPQKDKLLRFKNKIIPRIKWRPEHTAIKKKEVV